MISLDKIELINDLVALKWSDSTESFISTKELRERSPSAETQGEKDLLGKTIGGGHAPTNIDNVQIKQWHFVGSYAIRFEFSDGHSTGIYSWDYLKEISA